MAYLQSMPVKQVEGNIPSGLTQVVRQGRPGYKEDVANDGFTQQTFRNSSPIAEHRDISNIIKK